MKIGVIADTHIPIQAAELPKKVYEDFQKVDLILHAGDLIDMPVLDDLKKLGPVHAVYGNMDMPAVRKALPFKEVIKAGRFSIGLIHGWGPPARLVELVRKEFKDVDAIVFGHSHEPLNLTEYNILFFNPGSPTDKIFAEYNSYGILEIDDQIKGRIIRL